MRRRLIRGAMLLLAAVVIPVLAGTEPLADGLQRCAREGDERVRLACFDALVNALRQITTDQFGMTADIAHQRNPEARRTVDDEVLTGKITALRQAVSGEWIFTLDNQQIWMQLEAQPSIGFAVGEGVRIEHGAMGSLWLAAANHRKIRVKRLE
jgi:hypothetical protein